MSYKSVLKSNRVFLDPGNTVANTTLSDSYVVAPETPIPVVSTSNFKQAGYLTINTESVFYYTGKTTTTFTGITKISGASSFSSGIQVSQTYTVPNQTNTEDPGLAGWYIDGASNQASLRVSDTPVIQTGVIRYTSDTGFQGCTSTSPITWENLTSVPGTQGPPGIINGIIEFEYKTPTGYPTSNSAGIIAPESLNTDVTDNTAPPIYIKKIVSGSTVINGMDIDTTQITDNSDSVVLNTVAQPYTWDLSGPLITTLRTPISPDTIKHYGQTERYLVRIGKTVTAGQAVRFTSESGQLVIEPFTYLSTYDLDPYSPVSISIAFAGIALDTVTGDGTVFANVCSSGIVPIKITPSIVPTVYGSHNESIQNAGLACILNTDGYGAACYLTSLPIGTKWFDIGNFIESGGVALPGSFVLIKLNSRFQTA